MIYIRIWFRMCKPSITFNFILVYCMSNVPFAQVSTTVVCHVKLRLCLHDFLAFVWGCLMLHNNHIMIFKTGLYNMVEVVHTCPRRNHYYYTVTIWLVLVDIVLVHLGTPSCWISISVQLRFKTLIDIFLNVLNLKFQNCYSVSSCLSLEYYEFNHLIEY